MKIIALTICCLLFLAGCTKYSSYTKCKIVEEQKGSSPSSTWQYCLKLVETNKIQCDIDECK